MYAMRWMLLTYRIEEASKVLLHMDQDLVYPSSPSWGVLSGEWDDERYLLLLDYGEVVRYTNTLQLQDGHVFGKRQRSDSIDMGPAPISIHEEQNPDV